MTTIKKSYIKNHDLFFKYSKSYYLGALLFPFDKFKLICAFYGFVRHIDNIVDEFQDKEKLEIEKGKFFSMYDSGVCKDNFYLALLDTINKLKLPRDVFERFFDSMEMDINNVSYETMDDLKKYMDGSAKVIGEVMLYIMVNNSSPELIKYARKLGEAFQLTNFIRDIKEDYNMNPKRVYIPNEYLKKYNVTFENEIVDDRFIRMIRELIIINRTLYKEAQKGIDCLPDEDRAAIQLSKNLYSSILNEIEDSSYELFGSKIKVSFYSKLWKTYKTLGIINLGKVIINYMFYAYCF